MLILQTLQWGPQHGYAIGQTIRTESAESLRIETGSLYPALHRLEKQGWVKSDWKLTEANQRAKFYRLTPKGKKQLLQERDRWSQLVSAIGTILQSEAYQGADMNPLRWLFRRGPHRRRPRHRDSQPLRNGDRRAHCGRRGSGIRAPRRDQRVRQRVAGEGRGRGTCGAAAWWHTLGDVWQDVRFGIRMLVKNPAFSLTVITVLSIGIAGNAAIFSLFKGLALKPLPGVARLVDHGGTTRRTIDGRSYRRVAARFSRDQGTRSRIRDAERVVHDLCECRTRRRRETDRRRARHRQLLPGARCRRPTRPRASAVGRRGGRPASGGGDQRHAVASVVRGRSGHRRHDAPFERPAAHHCWRRRGRLQRHRRQHGR